MTISKHTLGVLLLVATTVVWGTTFPLVKVARESLEPAQMLALRFAIATLALLPWLRLANRALWRDGFWLAVLLFVAFATQVSGAGSVSAGRAAFIVGLNVVIVPLCLPLLGRRVPVLALLGALLAFTGIGVMSWDAGALRFGAGDVWMLACAVAFAVYVLLLERVAPKHPPLPLAAVQVAVVAVLGLLWAAPGLPSLGAKLGGFSPSLWVSLVYLGLVAVALSTLVQTVAQRHVPAFQAAVIYALEPVFAAAFAYLWLAEQLSWRGYVGAALILTAMLLSQWPANPRLEVARSSV